MTATTRLNFDAPLMDTLSEGVILLDHLAQVTTHNQAALPWVKQIMARSSAIKVLIDLEVRSRVKLPVKLGNWQVRTDDDKVTASVWLIRNGRRDYAIYIAPSPENTGDREELRANSVAEKSFLLLLGEEARAQLCALQMLLNPQAGNSMRDIEAVGSQSQSVLTLLQQLSDLTLLMQRDEVFADERLDLPTLINGSFPPVSPDPDQPRFELTQDGSGLGVVYGHAAWMSYALRVLFDALQDSAPVRSLVAVSLRQLGNFVVLTARVTNATARRKVRPVVATHSGESSAAKSPLSDDSVRWLMCRRILALQGGQLKLEVLPLGPSQDPANPPIESFTLTLATGLPLQERSRESCSSCRYTLQAQAYATDLSQLLTTN